MDAVTTRCLITAACVYHVTPEEGGVCVKFRVKGSSGEEGGFFLRQLEGHGGAPQQP